MYDLVMNKGIDEYIYFCIQKYFKNFEHKYIRKHFNVTISQFFNLNQQMDVGGPYKDFDEMYKMYNKEPGTDKNIKIGKEKYKKIILLLINYNKNIIELKK